jgi:hypothetical protein
MIMKFSLAALVAACALTSSAFAAFDIPPVVPPHFAATFDIPPVVPPHAGFDIPPVVPPHAGFDIPPVVPPHAAALQQNA